MKLTAYEKDVLSGKHGEGLRLAMEVLVQMGELYGAEYLIPVQNAHIDGAAYTNIWDAGTEFVEFLADNGARVPQPTTINPISHSYRNWEELGQSEWFVEKSRRLSEAYLRLGVSPTFTCAPYQSTNLPRFGEIVSWSESNAVNFVNSVIGARAERLPDLMDVCCAVLGRVPAYGHYLKENRRGDVLYRLEGFDDSWFRDIVDYSVLGYYIGEDVGAGNPVISGLNVTPSMDQVKAFSAAAASGGAVCMFHIVGFTPEAPTLEEAFQGWTGYETKVVTPDDLAAMKKKLDTAHQARQEDPAVEDGGSPVPGKADVVLIGCPHASFNELSEIADLIRGKHVADETEFWITTSETQFNLAVRSGAAAVLIDAGVKIACDTCVMELDEDGLRWKHKTFVTNSGKAAQYAPGINHCYIKLADTKGCVEAAVSGSMPGEVHQ